MEPERDPEATGPEIIAIGAQPLEPTAPPSPGPEQPYRGLKWIFIGPEGLRAGWSVLLFIGIFLLLANVFALALSRLHLITKGSGFTPRQQFLSELMVVVAMLIAAYIVAVIEKRSILDYNLRGPHRTVRFFSGFVVGFAALSALVGALAWGGWLHFGPVALHGSQVVRYGAIWGAVFLLVGCFEEGTMRCFLLSTLTRGINFWWAFGLIAAMCAFLLFRVKGHGEVGVYVIALLGLAPCLVLFLKRAPSAGFWNAAWFTSTFFGFGHTGNAGENWIGIFAAAFIGFVFCVSVWVTGSAWWAIGCHAAWDWAETYFYGTADSGFVAPGHLLSTSTGGNPLWSGGTDGPEGSLLILPIVLLILAWLLIVYRRPRQAEIVRPLATEQLAG